MVKTNRYLLILTLAFLFTLLLSTGSSAVHTDEPKEITLLSMKPLSNGSYQGGTATMTLDVRKGSGAVYIQSFPTSKVDTQTATRIANEVACDLSDVDCDSYDFFYTIEAGSSLIGGPSAGAATALLTLSALEEMPLDQNIAMTGAISSGGVVTPVAGIIEKAKAAEKAGIETVYIPQLSIMQPLISEISPPALNASIPGNATNASISGNETINTTIHNKTSKDVREELDGIDVEVVPVLRIEEAIEHATDGRYEHKMQAPIDPPETYRERMEETASSLCARAEKLMGEVPQSRQNTTLYTHAHNFYNNSQKAAADSEYYSQASYCYTTNLRLRELSLQNASQELLQENYDRLIQARSDFETQIDNQTLETFSDLETYVIVKERLLETKNYLDRINRSNISSSLLAYSIERYYSGVAWSGFFGMQGEKLQLDDRSMQVAAVKELHNVETRMNYLRTFIPEPLLQDVANELEQAYDYMGQKEYALTLFKASKAKAQADLFMSTISLKKGLESTVLEVKVNRTSELISEQQEKGLFPILGYSYMEYSKRLVDEDPVSALLFAEYALQLSDLARYFPQDDSRILWKVSEEYLVSFISGFITAILFMYLSSLIASRKRTRRTRRSSSKKKTGKKPVRKN
ncbi:MAG: S16 family serine protease [Candidatus Woesearchaeota archaeon]